MAKVAVIISGQLRNWKIALENQKWFFSTTGDEVDYFVHTWDYSMDRPGLSKDYNYRDVTPEEFKEFVDAYKPKKFILDKKKQEFFYDNDHWSSLFYSLSQSIMLKREYEIENNFEYDVVFKTRPDVCFNPAEPIKWEPMEDNMFMYTHGGYMEHEFYSFNINDCVFGCNSYTMDMLANLYFFRQYQIHDKVERDYNPNFNAVGPGVLMHDYMREYGITPFKGLDFIETLVKEGCPEDLHLLNVEHWKIMEKYFRNWYHN